jgi:hypothetical protein
LRESLQNGVHQIALGVDHHRGPSRLGVLEDELGKKGRLPRTGLPDDVDVVPRVEHDLAAARLKPVLVLRLESSR